MFHGSQVSKTEVVPAPWRFFAMVKYFRPFYFSFSIYFFGCNPLVHVSSLPFIFLLIYHSSHANVPFEIRSVEPMPLLFASP